MIPDKVSRILEAAGLRALEFEPGSTPTAPLAAARIGVEVGQIAKSLLFRAKDVPVAVVINEAVDVCKFFGTRESGRFVNGILDRIAKERPADGLPPEQWSPAP